MRTLLPLATLLLVSGSALASSHRESPNILNDAAADLTDVYSFKSPSRPANQVFIMNVSPAYNAGAGPNWYMFDPNVLYELNIDTTGSGSEAYTYQFRFSDTSPSYKDATNGDASILPYSASIVSYDAANHVFQCTNALTSKAAPCALSQTYTVTKVVGGRRTGTASSIGASGVLNLPVAPPRIGPFTTDGGNANIGNDTKRYAAYQTLANNANITADSGYMFFAGPRNDPFFVDLGGIFDGVNVRLLNSAPNGPKDSLAGTNVLSIVFEVPVSELGGAEQFGVWATTSRPQAMVKDINGNASHPGGGWVQVQRLGNPLVNEVVIGVKDKDKWGYTEPKDDVTNYASYVLAPQLATALNALYGPTGVTAKNLISTIPDTNRYDLVDVFVTGIPGVSQINPKGDNGDMLRVNRNLMLGSPAAYTEGWPLNGRKLAEPVVAIALSFLAGCNVLPYYGNFPITAVTGFNSNKWSATHTVANPTTFTPLTTPANCLLSDGLTADDKTPGGSGHLADFPYEDLPFAAY